MVACRFGDVFMNRPYFAFVVMSALLASSASWPESVGDVIREFGLTGTWSLDCSKDIKTELAGRTVYETTSLGGASQTNTTRFQNGMTFTVRSEIPEAIKIPSDKIKLQLKPVEGKYSDGRTVQEPMPLRILILQKLTPDKTVVIQNKAADGSSVFVDDGKLKDGTPMLPFERCLN